MHELILGGCKSGKSRCAEQRASDWLAWPGRTACLIATALPGDGEMHERIARHRADRARRVPALGTIEVPVALADVVTEHSAEHRLLVVDCLTLWLTNLLMPLDGVSLTDDAWAAQAQGLVDALRQARGPVVLVSNEFGWGVSPLGAEARRFVDALGTLHQRVAFACSHVTLMVAGHELAVKGRRS
jgi:adenosylcobinamide kinase/adenosylcobinamide-phosphate guanylyltransferase